MIIPFILSIFFSLLYHAFAWTYDLVAWSVSLGNWRAWVRCALPHLNGPTLEIGFGPGHLQAELGERGLTVFGLDESRQMATQAARRLRRKNLPARLVRGLGQRLPFTDHSFERVVATFPTEYIYSPETLAEIRRVLRPDGLLVVVPAAWITGGCLLERLAAWLFQVTGQASSRVGELPVELRERFLRAGFRVRSELVELKDSRVLVLLAENSGAGK